MKKHTLVLLTALFASSTSLLSAQDYAFKVLANKGSNEIKSGQTWQPLKTGASLKSGDEVKLGDNAYIGLVHVSGKPVEVKEAGVYAVSALENKVGNATSVLNKYTDFILSSNSASRPKNRLSATGAVHRAVSNAPIKLILPDNQSAGIFNKTAIINWEASNVAGPYVITVKNMFEDILLRAETAETTYQIDLNDARYANENAILVEVSAKADPKLVSKPHLIKRLSPAENEQIATALKELTPVLSEETAMNKVYLAGFYEQHKLLIDAISAYEQALKLQPDVESFKESYNEFLVRNNLK